MTVPKILYHGTSGARWHLGIKQQGLRGDMERHLMIDNAHFGYVFLCDNIDDAAFYSLLTSAYDDTIPTFRDLNKIIGKGIVIAVRTSTIRKNIEPDPERRHYEDLYRAEGTFDAVKNLYMNGNWYRHKGSISKAKIFPYLDVPLSKQDKGLSLFTKLVANESVFEERIRRMAGAIING